MKHLIRLMAVVGLLITASTAFSQMNENSFPPFDFQRGTIVKGMLFPTLLLNNVSIGAEKLKGSRYSWNATLDATNLNSPVTRSLRFSFRAGPRMYLFPFRMRENNPVSYNLFTEGYVGASLVYSSAVEVRSNQEFRSVFGGLAIGQQLFYHRLSLDVATGISQHYGNRKDYTYAANSENNTTWLGAVIHVQVGYLINRKQN
ncbi:MAG: hypothetical protein ACFB10_19615 [Salibacteraceae bacterium]